MTHQQTGRRKLWCCQCQEDVDARLTSGAEAYPHRPDLAELPRWICDGCKNHVGTHHKTANPTLPLGNIPSAEIKKARIHIHSLIDPAWKSKKIRRKEIYAHLSKIIGREYHTAELRTVEEARSVYAAAREFLKAKEAGRTALAGGEKMRTSEVKEAIGRLRRSQPRNSDTLLVCSFAEDKLKSNSDLREYWRKKQKDWRARKKANAT